MTVQIVVRVDDADAARVDRLVERGRYASRSEAVRDGLAVILDREARAAVGRSIAAGYSHLPQAGDDLERSTAATAAMIAEEPW